ncbi:MAG: 2-oxoglutarate oxidoreductase [Spirochaetes bacterium GWF1_41_5]|nr:MAG: 2-oxoglutarate oxidoreductase [Spirochaetes bacterium GWF1_41_5]HBE01266.1 2-oxoglutarate oxidoreductase [Spirochaetia bacterium]
MKKALRPGRMSYCPGCGHTIIHRIMGDLIDEMNLREKTIGSAPVGCSVLLYNFFDFDIIECAHGRVPAVMTAIKRLRPDKFVFAYQGDGDLAAIGTNETIHAANRGENISVIFVNNAVYGMTRGQMAPTTLPGQITTTTPRGRGQGGEGSPMKMCELISTLEAPVYVERTAVNNAEGIKKTREALKKSFLCQLEGRGYSFIEILAMCPTNWKISTKESLQFVTKMESYFPLGVFKDKRNFS